MTRNQIAYQTLQEQRRANLVNEGISDSRRLEEARHNVVTEGLSRDDVSERARHNLVTEGQTLLSLNETVRHNQATEGLTGSQVNETRRHNIANEGLEQQKITETNRANVAKEIETNRANTTKEQETQRHNLVSEYHDKLNALAKVFSDLDTAALVTTYESIDYFTSGAFANDPVIKGFVSKVSDIGDDFFDRFSDIASKARPGTVKAVNEIKKWVDLASREAKNGALDVADVLISALPVKSWREGLGRMTQKLRDKNNQTK